jgi:dephospho-CoA kinase
VCRILNRLGIDVLYLDELSRKAVEPGRPALQRIISAFGEEVVQQNGTLNRRRLRHIIASDPAAKHALERILHPEIGRMMIGKILEARTLARPLVVEVPLLYEAGLSGFFDYVLAVTAPRAVQIRRIMSRDNVSYDEAELLVGMQMPQEQKAAKADFVIVNDGSSGDLEEAVNDFYDKVFQPLADKTA